MMFDNGGCGLAAPQIGELIQLVVIDTDDTGADDYDPYVLINPVIVEQSDTLAPSVTRVACPFRALTARFLVPITWLSRHTDLDANLMRYEAAGDLMCVCLQHEIDHLHGKTMFERLAPGKRIAALHDYQEARARGARPGETE